MSSHEPYIVLEVGCGLQPFPAYGQRPFLPGEQYIGLDLFRGRSDQYIRNLEASTRYLHEYPADIRLQRDDGTALPFRESSVDEMVFVNVFGDSRTRPYQSQFRREATRVLRATGSLSVVESLSTSEMPLDELVADMGKAGFAQLNAGFEHNPDLLAQYVYPTQKIRMGLIDHAYVATFVHPLALG